MRKEKIWNFIIYFLFCISLYFTIYFGYKYYESNKFVEQYRLELGQSRERNKQYEELCNSARQTNTDLANCLSRNITTISELRKQLQEVRTITEEMEKILYNSELYSSSSSDNYTNNYNQ